MAKIKTPERIAIVETATGRITNIIVGWQPPTGSLAYDAGEWVIGGTFLNGVYTAPEPEIIEQQPE